MKKHHPESDSVYLDPYNHYRQVKRDSSIAKHVGGPIAAGLTAYVGYETLAVTHNPETLYWIGLIAVAYLSVRLKAFIAEANDLLSNIERDMKRQFFSHVNPFPGTKLMLYKCQILPPLDDFEIARYKRRGVIQSGGVSRTHNENGSIRRNGQVVPEQYSSRAPGENTYNYDFE